MNQLNFSIRVRVPTIDMDSPRRKITKRHVKRILRAAFKGALTDRRFDVTMWDMGGSRIAHFDSDPQPYKQQTLISCFRNPLGR